MSPWALLFWLALAVALGGLAALCLAVFLGRVCRLGSAHLDGEPWYREDGQ
jgi:hypothetical protein